MCLIVYTYIKNIYYLYSSITQTAHFIQKKKNMNIKIKRK